MSQKKPNQPKKRSDKKKVHNRSKKVHSNFSDADSQLMNDIRMGKDDSQKMDEEIGEPQVILNNQSMRFQQSQQQVEIVDKQGLGSKMQIEPVEVKVEELMNRSIEIPLMPPKKSITFKKPARLNEKYFYDICDRRFSVSYFTNAKKNRNGKLKLHYTTFSQKAVTDFRTLIEKLMNRKDTHRVDFIREIQIENGFLQSSELGQQLPVKITKNFFVKRFSVFIAAVEPYIFEPSQQHALRHHFGKWRQKYSPIKKSYRQLFTGERGKKSKDLETDVGCKIPLFCNELINLLQMTGCTQNYASCQMYSKPQFTDTKFLLYFCEALLQFQMGSEDIAKIVDASKHSVDLKTQRRLRLHQNNGYRGILPTLVRNIQEFTYCFDWKRYVNEIKNGLSCWLTTVCFAKSLEAAPNVGRYILVVPCSKMRKDECVFMSLLQDSNVVIATQFWDSEPGLIMLARFVTEANLYQDRDTKEFKARLSSGNYKGTTKTLYISTSATVEGDYEREFAWSLRHFYKQTIAVPDSYLVLNPGMQLVSALSSSRVELAIKQPNVVPTLKTWLEAADKLIGLQGHEQNRRRFINGMKFFAFELQMMVSYFIEASEATKQKELKTYDSNDNLYGLWFGEQFWLQTAKERYSVWLAKGSQKLKNATTKEHEHFKKHIYKQIQKQDDPQGYVSKNTSQYTTPNLSQDFAFRQEERQVQGPNGLVTIPEFVSNVHVTNKPEYTALEYKQEEEDALRATYASLGMDFPGMKAYKKKK